MVIDMQIIVRIRGGFIGKYGKGAMNIDERTE